MKRSEYFVTALRKERWRSLHWRLAVFNVALLPEDYKPKDYDLNYIEGFPHYFMEGEWIKVEDGVENKALFKVNEKWTLPAGMWGDDSKEIATSPGRVLANYTVWYFAFGPRFEFVNSNTLPDKWLDDHLHLGVDDSKAPSSGEYFTATELGRFIQGVVEMKALSTYITPTGTEITLGTHPKMKATRERLLKEHKDELHKPSVVAKIIDELDALDREWLSQDESIEYYDSPKARNRRRKLYVIEGASSAFREDGSFILQSDPLMDGWKKEELVAKNNETREGSYQRGSETAKGGEKVTFLQSTFQNHVVTHGDCGAEALPEDITKENYKLFIGLNAKINGKIVPFDEELAKSSIGKTIPLRRSFLCKQDHIDTCSTCANDYYAREPHAIANEEASIGSYTMYGAMSAMHASDLEVADFIPKYHIS